MLSVSGGKEKRCCRQQYNPVYVTVAHLCVIDTLMIKEP